MNTIFIYIYIYKYIYIYIYIYIFIYIYIYIADFCNFKECSTLGANISCLKKRHLCTTKVSCSLQSSDILFVLCSKNNKNICHKQYIKKYISTNEIKDIGIQFCETLSKTFY